MEWIWKSLRTLEENFSSPASSASSLRKRPTKLNDYVYELCKPEGRPSVEVVFFHGLQMSGSNEAFLTTWLSGDEEAMKLWPSWIAESFPEARILLISYDCFARKKDDQGITDPYVTGENLVQSLTEEAAQVGRDGCPVIMVGHCLGGLVMKELLLRADFMVSLHERDNSKEYVQCLLESLKQLFYYATPHHGSRFADIKTEYPKGKLVKRVQTLNKEAARCNEDFRQLRRKYNWKADGIAESLPVTLGNFKSQVLVEEASTRSDVDTLYTVKADHFDVCRPKFKTDSSYSQLINVIDRALKEDMHGHNMSFSSEVVGLDDQVKIVKEALKRAGRLGIVGTGGMGKSTLAKVVYNSISGDFEYTYFLSNVKNFINKTNTMEVLQGKILESLYYRGRRKMVKLSRLKGKKVLFILDDVEHESQVYTRLDGFSNESCVLITSREGGFVRSLGFEVHNAKLLGDEPSKRLFCLHAFQGADPPDNYTTRVALFLKKCRGLPLALEVVGKYLSTQTAVGVWDDTLKKMSQAKPLDGRKDDDLWSVFQVIYDHLAEDEQQMFLDIAACFQDEELESVKRAWRACSWAESAADAGWQNLLDKGLVTMSSYQGKWQDGIWTEDIWIIQMHEVLRDLGRSIALSTKIDQKSTRLALTTWQPNQRKPNFEVRILKIIVNSGSHHPIDITTLSGLEKLEILCLDGVSLSGAWNLFPNNLAFLKLRRCSWSDNDDFERSSNRIAVEGSSSRREASSRILGKHPTLRHFEIEGFEDLQHLLDTLGLDSRGPWKALEELVFDNREEHFESRQEHCFKRSFREVPSQETSVQTLPDTFEQLRHIRVDDYRIIISCCSGLVAPTKNLSISHCRSLIEVPYTLGQLGGLRHFVISCCPDLVFLPATLLELGALERLEISYCERLLRLPGPFEQLRYLEDLEIQGLPQSFGSLRSLRHFVISNCPRLGGPPEEMFGQLAALEHLEISYCNGLEGLPQSFGSLRCLRHFVISNCPLSFGLPETFGQLRALEHLEISYCNGLEGLPQSFGSLRGLRHFVISNCEWLDGLPETFGQLSALEHLEISRCNGLEGLPQSFGSLRGLRHFEISNCAWLDGLPETFGQLSALEHLEISRCNGLEGLPQSFGSLRCLRHFVISNCPLSFGLPETFGQLRALEHLEISYCKGLQDLPESFGSLCGLRHFVISNCPLSWYLPETFGQLRALEHLEISYCNDLRALPQSFGLLRGLRHFVISNCPRSWYLPETFGQLRALEHLEISYCNDLRALPQSFGLLRGLRHFVISNCPDLSRLPHSLGEFPALEHLDISYCDSLQALPNSRLLLGRSPCNFCGNSGHIPLTRLKSHLIILAAVSSQTTKLEDPPEDSDEAENSPDSSDGGDE